MRRLLLLFLVFMSSGYATVVEPPTWAELVRGSGLIFRGEVTAMESIWRGSGSNRHIATLVTFRIEHRFKGYVYHEVTLEFGGGEIGRVRTEVIGVPVFSVGQRGVYFVGSVDNHLCPIMRLRYGRYPIHTAHGTEWILRDDGEPLRAVQDVKELLGGRSARAPITFGLTLEAFESLVAEQVEASK